MIRRMFSIAAAISFVLFMVCAVLWVVSRASPQQVVFVRGGCFWDFHVTGGGAGFGRYAGWPRNEPAIRSTPAKHPIGHLRMDFIQHRSPFGAVTTGTATIFDSANPKADPWGNPAPTTPMPYIMVGARLPNVARLALLLPAIWVVMWYRRRKRGEGRGFAVQMRDPFGA